MVSKLFTSSRDCLQAAPNMQNNRNDFAKPKMVLVRSVCICSHSWHLVLFWGYCNGKRRASLSRGTCFLPCAAVILVWGNSLIFFSPMNSTIYTCESHRGNCTWSPSRSLLSQVICILFSAAIGYTITAEIAVALRVH